MSSHWLAMPISQIDALFFLNFVSCINPGIASDLSNSHELRSAVIQRAVALHNSISTATSGSRFMNSMADGVPKAARAWPGICLGTASQIHLRRLVHDIDQKAWTIAQSLTHTVLDLRMRR
jgi:hypothetical protein